MPGLNGIEATREILRASPRVGVLVLTMFEDDDSVFAAMLMPFDPTSDTTQSATPRNIGQQPASKSA